MSETAPIDPGAKNHPGDEAFFHAGRVALFFCDRVNRAASPDNQGELFRVTPQDADEVAGYISIYALASSELTRTKKTALVLTSHLEGHSPSRTMQLANARFKYYLPRFEPTFLNPSDIDNILDEAAGVIAGAIETGDYGKTETLTAEKRPNTVQEAVQRWTVLCQLQEREWRGFVSYLHPEIDDKTFDEARWMAFEKIRKCLDKSMLLSGGSPILTKQEKLRVIALLHSTDPQSLHAQIQTALANGRYDPKEVQTDLYSGLLKCAKNLDGSA